MYLKFYILLIVVIVLIIGGRNIGVEIPAYSPVSRLLVLALVVGYVPLWVSAVRRGAIIIPPQLVRRAQRPSLFWFVVCMHGIMVVFAAGALVSSFLG
jgi:hypothetical protein